MIPLTLWVLLVVFRQHGVFAGSVIPFLPGVVFHAVGLVAPVKLVQWISVDVRFPLFISLMAVLPLLAMPMFRRVLKLHAREDGNHSDMKNAG